MLRTIGNNFASAANDAGEIEYKVGGVTKSLSLMDETTGDMKSTFQIFKDLKSDWDNMSSSEQQSIALAYAGKNQFEVFGAVMNNFQAAIDATNTAYDSQNSAMNENASYMESIEAKLQNLKAAYENFASNTVTKEFIGSILDAGTKLLEFANTDMGQAVAKAVLFGGAITGITGIAGEFIAKIVGIASSIKKATSGVEGFLGMAAGGKWTVIALAIGAVAAAIILIVNAIKNSSDKFDKFMGKIDQSKQKTQEYQQSLDNAKKRLQELNDIPVKDRSSEQQHEIDTLEDKIEYYERLIELEKEERRQAANAAYAEATKSGVKMGVERYEFTPSALITSDVKTLTEAQKEAVSQLPQTFNSVEEAVDAYAKALGLSWTKANGVTKTTEEMREELKQYGLGVKDVTEDISDSARQFDEMWSKLMMPKGGIVSQQDLDTTKAWLDANKNIADAIQTQIDLGNEISDADRNWLINYNRLTGAYNHGVQELEKYNAAVKIAKDTLADLPDTARDTGDAITQVAKTLVQNGDLGIDSVEKLKSTLQSMIDDGIFGDLDINLDNLITELLDIGAINFDDKNINVETNAEEANNELAELDTEDEEKQITVTTAEEGQALASALQEISNWIDQVNGKTVKVTLEADATTAKDQINSVVQEVNNITAGVNVEITTNATEVAGQLQAVQSVVQALSGYNPTVNVRANTTQAMTALRNVQSYSISNKSFSVYCDSYSALTKLRTIANELNGLKDKTIHVTVAYGTSGEKPAGLAKGTKSAPGGLALINDGTPVNGSAGELVVHNGVGQIFNDGKETVQPIPKGAKIYTARQTQDILKDRGLTVDDVAKNPIPALANGTNNKKYPDYRNDPTYSGVTELTGSGDDLKENFSEWLKEKKHWLNMDIISEAQYYRDLEIMNEKYLNDLAEAKDEYWSHEEEIYKYQNQSLEDQIKLEEKLSDLAKAKENRVYALSGGRFQYLQNLDAIAKAQREVDQLTGKYANGTTNARGGLSLVGENGPEMRVLGHGDGIIPAEATKNLMALSSLNIKDALSNIGRAIVTNYSFDISRLELPSASNAGEFLDGLKNLAYQYSYARA